MSQEPLLLQEAAGEQYSPIQMLIADLRDLTLDLKAGGYSPTVVAMFQRALQRAVPSALGATIVVELTEPATRALELNLLDRPLDPAEIAVGLRIPLTAFQSSLSGSVLFYAEAPAAFDDLAVGLLRLLQAGPEYVDRSPQLPSAPLEPSVAGLQDLSLVNQALGVLLNRGYSLSEARSDIRDRAAQAHTDISEAARTLLNTFPTRRRDFGSDPPLAVRPPHLQNRPSGDARAHRSDHSLRDLLELSRDEGLAG